MARVRLGNMPQGALVREKIPCHVCGHQQQIITDCYERCGYANGVYCYYHSDKGALCMKCAKKKGIL